MKGLVLGILLATLYGIISLPLEYPGCDVGKVNYNDGDSMPNDEKCPDIEQGCLCHCVEKNGNVTCDAKCNDVECPEEPIVAQPPEPKADINGEEPETKAKPEKGEKIMHVHQGGGGRR